MTARDSIHVSMSEPLRRAEVRPRLERLAQTTGLPVALVAARALALGLPIIEGDLSRIFPAAAASTAPPDERASDAAPASDVSPNGPPQTADTQHAIEQPTGPTAPAQDAQDRTGPRAKRLSRVSSEDAARALGKSITAFQAYVHRHPELRRHAKRKGRAAMWDLAGLRAEWGQR
jgi:hypothetical protein